MSAPRYSDTPFWNALYDHKLIADTRKPSVQCTFKKKEKIYVFEHTDGKTRPAAVDVDGNEVKMDIAPVPVTISMVLTVLAKKDGVLTILVTVTDQQNQRKYLAILQSGSASIFSVTDSHENRH